MKYCPHCDTLISDDTLVICPVCRRSTTDRSPEAPVAAPVSPLAAGRLEYRSKTELFGLPLVHIVAYSSRSVTGVSGIPHVSIPTFPLRESSRRVGVAKGIIAIGDVAIGVLAMGGLAIGGVTFGGLGVGIIAFGGVAAGVVALGGFSLALALAVGGFALSTFAALGGLAIAPFTISSLGASPELLRFFDRVLPGLSQYFP